jgi:LEA14-like dessication related protein
VKTRCGIILACFLVSACVGFAKREPLSVTIAQITPVEFGLLEQRYLVKARVLNPNDSEVSFDGLVFDLEVNGKPFAKGVSDRGGTVPRFGEAMVELQMVSSIQNALRQIREIQKSPRPGFTYRVKGSLHIAGGYVSIPFDTAGELALPFGGEKPQE